jgi:phosphopantothenoylcysteine decarboxylase/phosphopantothenate--cysteine ligase
MLACGYEGKGKLPPVETILHQIEEMDPGVEKVLKGKKVLVTAGGTIEDIDPVRFITNRSSGKMGFAFAEIAHRLGADVELIYAQTDHPPTPFLKSIFTRSAEDMLKALEARIEEADILIMAAAVADFRPAKTASKKIKKQDGNPVIELAENPDLLKTLGKNKKETQIFVGFALETDDLLENAQKKLKSKNLDMILANSPENFESESGKVQILFPGGDKEELPQISKMEIARKVYGILSKRFL